MSKLKRVALSILAVPIVAASWGQALADDSGIIARAVPQLDRATQVYGLDEPYVLEIEILNPTDQAIKGTHVDWRVSSWDGEECSKSEPVDLPPKITTKVSLPYKAGKFGWFELTADVLRADGTSISEDKRVFAVSNPVKSKGAYFRYGICTHTCGRTGDAYDKEFALIDKLGVDIVRDGPISWSGTEPAQGTWNYERGDKYVGNLERMGVELLSIFGDTPKWAASYIPRPKATVLPKKDAMMDFGQNIATHYKDKVRYWEYSNEEDIGWTLPPAQYADVLNAFFTGVMMGNPSAQCMNGGFAVVKRNPFPNFVNDVVPLIDQKDWAIYAYHDYNTFENMCTRYRDAVRPIYDKAGLKMPIWINEGGFNMLLPGGGERTQAVELAKKYASAPWLGVSAYFWYDLRDDGIDPNNKEHHFGLASNNFEPKPSYSVYQAVIRELSNASYVGTLDGSVPPDVHTFIYRNHDTGAPFQYTMVAWRDGASKTPVLISGEKGAKIISADDIMGNPIHLDALQDNVAASLGPEPVYFHATGAEFSAQIQPLLNLPMSFILLPGKPGTVSLTINNPMKQDVHVALDASSPDLPGAKWSFSDANPVVKAGDHVAVKTTMTLSAGDAAKVPWEKVLRSVVTTKFGDNLTVKSEVPCEVAMAVPRLKNPTDPTAELAAADSLTFNLNTHDYIYNLYSAELKRQTQWAGPDDLSATASFAYDDQYLHINVVAKDDVQFQNNLDQNLKDGDSLEIGVSLADDPTSLLEIGVAMKTDGTTGGWIFTRSPQASIPLGNLTPAYIPFTVERKDTFTTYHVAIPWTALGSKGAPANGFRLNFFVNDNDGVGGRKQYLRLSGDSSGTRNPNSYRTFFCP